MCEKLTDRFPPLDVDRLLSNQVPPPQFALARFDTYVPDISQPSQAAALRRMKALVHSIMHKKKRRNMFRKKSYAPGIYLDGGYGVGKTHLLASLAHELGPEACTYGTFMEYTHLVGALGYGQTVSALRSKAVVCIDEFELDDPGDTLIISRMIKDLSDHGVRVVATSNTEPEALGQGRFAAEDFTREIQALAQRFEIIRIDGPDYRARKLNFDLPILTTPEVRTSAIEEKSATLDDFADLLSHLGQVHPSRYGQLVDGVGFVGLTNGHTVDDDVAGLRLVVLVDRLYDRSVQVGIADVGIGEVFSERMLTGGYRKKYFRATSRLAALSINAEVS